MTRKAALRSDPAWLDNLVLTEDPLTEDPLTEDSLTEEPPARVERSSTVATTYEGNAAERWAAGLPNLAIARRRQEITARPWVLGPAFEQAGRAAVSIPEPGPVADWLGGAFTILVVIICALGAYAAIR